MTIAAIRTSRNWISCDFSPVTVLAAALSYRWLESPFLRLKERFAAVKSRPV